MVAQVLEHITSQGDRWDLLAWHYYGDARLYEPIIAANPEVAIVPVLEPGIRILIPLLESTVDGDVTTSEELPPWRR